jgi:hypothetical protein
MKNKFLLIASFLVCQFGFAQNNEASAKLFVNNFFGGKFQDCTALFDDQVKAQITPEVLQMAKSQITGINGDFKSIISTQSEEDKPYNYVFCKIQFAKKSDYLKIVFSDKNKIVGFFVQPPSNAILNRPQTPKSLFDYIIEDVEFKNENQGNLLAGTLSLPKDKKNFPIAILITGSGAQNRDEEIFGHKPFAVIADDFAKKGIATLRLDDRGVGGSGKGKENPSTLDFSTDINSAVNYLAQKGYKNIGLIGHSEGGMIAPMVANENKNVKFMILLAGPGIPIKDLMVTQNYEVGKSQGISEDELQENIKNLKQIYGFIDQYKGADLKTDLAKFETQILEKNEEYKKDPKKIEEIVNSQVKMITNPWFLYFLKQNPQLQLQKIKIPTLALNGSKDVQVSATENLNGIKNTLTKAGNTNFKTVEIPNLNHLFQTSKTGAVSEYSEIEETFSPTALNLMSDWILKLK